MVAADIDCLVEPGVARSVRKAVPDAAAGAVGGGRSFDLVRRGRCSPDEIRGEPVVLVHPGGGSGTQSGIHKTKAGSCKLTNPVGLPAFIPAHMTILISVEEGLWRE